MRKITLDELREELLAQGVPWEHLAFKCVSCGAIQSRQDLVDAGAAPTIEDAQRYWGFSCIGRFRRGVGCDWTLGGLFRIHVLEVDPGDGKEPFPCFEVATAEEAREHLATREGATT